MTGAYKAAIATWSQVVLSPLAYNRPRQLAQQAPAAPLRRLRQRGSCNFAPPKGAGKGRVYTLEQFVALLRFSVYHQIAFRFPQPFVIAAVARQRPV